MNSPRRPIGPRPIGEDDLLAYVDDALDPGRRAEVDAYLATQPHLAARVAQDRAVADALRAALAPVAQEPVPMALSLPALMARRAAARERVRRVWAMGGRAAAAVALLVVGGAGGWSLRASTHPGAMPGEVMLGREALVSFDAYAAGPRPMLERAAADRDDLARWASGRLHHPVMVPDLEPAGYHLLGGRVVATANGPAGLFCYEDAQGNRVAVMTRAMRRKGDTRMTAVTPPQADVSAPEGPAMAGYAWADDGMGYSLVGKDDARVLHPIADDARRQIRAALPRLSGL